MLQDDIRVRHVRGAVVFSKNTSNTMDEGLASMLLQTYGVLKTLLKTVYARPPSDQNIIKRRARLSLSSFHIHNLLAFSKIIRFIHVILFPPGPNMALFRHVRIVTPASE